MAKEEFNINVLKCNHISVLNDIKTNGCNCNHWKMLCPSEGIVTITAGSSVYEIGKGNIAFLSPKEFHCIKENVNSNYIFLDFEGQGSLLDKLSGTVFAISEREQLLIDDIVDIIDNSEDPIYNQQISSIIGLLFLRCCKKDAMPSDAFKERDVVLFAKAVDILSHSIQSQISVEELALELKISLSHLKRIFTRFTTLGVHEYFTYLKVEHAKELLKAGETVTQTAQLSGFSNQAYFSAAFKRITGVTPKEFAGDIKVIRQQKPKNSSNLTKERDLPNYLL